MKNKKAQVTIFIIIAIVLVGTVVGYFVLRDKIVTSGIPESIEPVYTTFLSCLEDNTLVGIDVLGSQGGYIELPDFEAGSEYMPFSNQLDFLGNPIPYWYYVSGNNIQREQVPSRIDMEDGLEGFIEDKINNCIFENYYQQGFEINMGEPKADVSISDNAVEVMLSMDLNINKEEDSALIKEHRIEVKSKLGILYNNAKKIYDEEQKNLFLENYAVDIMRLYAPVDGVELNCAPKTWSADKVFDELQEAIESNTLALKSKGGDYTIKNKENNYFVVDANIDSGIDVRFLNSKEWANGFEVSPSEESILIAKPVGNQPGLGALGFCYVPYHFVYNIRYPVLIQLFYGEEFFQFPVAVIIQGNVPREALDVTALELGVSDFCNYKNSFANVNVYDTSLNPVDARISYKCFNELCDIGKTKNGSLNENFPQCANGFVIAKADGFEDSSEMYSTAQEGSIDITMDKLYKKDIELKLDGKNYDGNAIIIFNSDKSSKTVVYPETKTVDLTGSQGGLTGVQYAVQVYIYRNSSIKLGESVKEQCVEVTQSGVGGFFGMKEEKCFDIVIPEQIISNALAGGGKENYYILEDELKNSNIIEINSESLQAPKTIEELQNNYVLFDNKNLDINFK